MPAVLNPPVRARQSLDVHELREEALRLYFAAVAAGDSQSAMARRSGKTTQSAISAAVNAPETEASTHGAVYAHLVNLLDPAYAVEKEDPPPVWRVRRKG